MADSTAARGSYDARLSGDKSVAPGRRVFDLHSRTFVFADSILRRRTSAPCEADEEVWPIPLVAEILSPFAGDRSELIAEALLERFGSLGSALAAPDRQILAACDKDRDVALLIIAARAMMQSALLENVIRSVLSPDNPSLHKYLIMKMQGKQHEELFAIFVDERQGFISEELISAGSADRVESRIRPIVSRAIELRAAGFYLVHNHPSRMPEPSAADVRATRAIAQVSRSLDLELFDHFVIAGEKVSSMKKLGLL